MVSAKGRRIENSLYTYLSNDSFTFVNSIKWRRATFNNLEIGNILIYIGCMEDIESVISFGKCKIFAR